MSKIKRLEDFAIFDFTGTVIDQLNWTEEASVTTVTDGSSHADQGYGRVPGPSRTTRTFTTQKLRMFLKMRGGGEEEITLSDPGLGVLRDHRVSVLYGRNSRDAAATAVAFCNHTTGRTKVYEAAIGSLIDQTSLAQGCLFLLVIPLVLSALGSAVGGAFGFMAHLSTALAGSDKFAERSMPGYRFDKAASLPLPNGEGLLAVVYHGLGPILWLLSVFAVALWLVRRRRSRSALRAAALERVRLAVQELQKAESPGAGEF